MSTVARLLQMSIESRSHLGGEQSQFLGINAIPCSLTVLSFLMKLARLSWAAADSSPLKEMAETGSS